MFKIVFLYAKNAVSNINSLSFSQLIKTHTVSSKRMTLDKLFIIKRSIIYNRKFYSFGNSCPLARMHCLVRETIA